MAQGVLISDDGAAMSTDATSSPSPQGASTEALLARLARVRRPAGRTLPIVDLPLPDVLARGLIMAALLLMGGWCLLLWWFSRDALALAEGVRVRQEHLRAAQRPALPLGEDLMAEGALEDAIVRHPGRLVTLRLLRAEARAAAGDTVGACHDYQQAQDDASEALAPEERLRWAGHLAALGRDAEAVPLLWGLPLGRLTEEERARAITLLAERAAPAVVGGH